METSVLLIDDQLFNLRLLVECLRDQKFKLSVAESGNKGLYLAETIRPDLILLDIRMPDMDGFMVYQHLLANPETANTLVIFLSAIDDIDYKEQALNLGGVDYITKPVNERELVARINVHLKRQSKYKAVLTKLAEYEHCIRLDKSTYNALDRCNLTTSKSQAISEYLLENLQCTPTLKQLAKIANTNRNDINVQFRDVFGMSIFEWLGEQRLLRAAVLLRTSAITIGNIANMVGYANTSALTHAFKRRFGCTPGDYRLADAQDAE